MGWLLAALAVWGLGLAAIRLAAARAGAHATWLVPLVFGAVALFLWQAAVRGFHVPGALLPAPSDVALVFADPAKRATLWGDFVQTVLKGALSGWLIGCGAALAVAVLVDRSDFLTRGLLPVGNFVAALPVIGVAPILVMWFGFGWESKAAVVVAMVFFPVLVNAVAGLKSADHMQRDLMRTYAANSWVTLWKLRIPAAMPFVFNGLKIAATLALIGAIVAEYFGGPTFGLGFRISTEVGRMGMDTVWAVIAVAALSGSVFYGLVALIERRVTFWHPSQR